MIIALVGPACGAEDDAGRSVAAAQYARERRQVRDLGRVVVSELGRGDAAAVAARFTPDLAERFSREQLAQLVAELRGAGGIGERTDEGELVPSPASRVYTAEHRVGDGRWSFALAFDRSGSISSGEVRPVEPLPPDPKAGYRPATSLRFPLDGEWFVYWGGDTDRTNYHVRAPAQRHAYDLTVWRDGGTHQGSGGANEDYWAWGQEIHAPAPGAVVAAVDGIADSAPQSGVQNSEDPAGNHVLIDIGHGEYLLLAHFRQGSVRVKAGDQVLAGQTLGVVGSSGNSSEPHLHVHLQDSPTALEGVGLPLPFSDLVIDGRPVDEAELEQGQFVRPA